MKWQCVSDGSYISNQGVSSCLCGKKKVLIKTFRCCNGLCAYNIIGSRISGGSESNLQAIEGANGEIIISKWSGVAMAMKMEKSAGCCEFKVCFCYFFFSSVTLLLPSGIVQFNFQRGCGWVNEIMHCYTQYITYV